MSSLVVRQKIAAYLTANWVLSPVAGEENEINDPPNTLEPWLSYGFAGNKEELISIGSAPTRCYRESGTIYFNAWVASGTGGNIALTHAEAIRDMMRHLDLGDGVRLGVARSPSTAIPSQTDSSKGNYFAYAVLVEYDYDYKA